MGYMMARNLANHSSSAILVYNRTRSKAEKLQKELGPNKIVIVDSVAEIAKQADVLFTNLANDAAVIQVYDEIQTALKVGLP